MLDAGGRIVAQCDTDESLATVVRVAARRRSDDRGTFETAFRLLVGEAFDEIHVEAFDYGHGLTVGVSCGEWRQMVTDNLEVSPPYYMTPRHAAERLLAWRGRTIVPKAATPQ